MDQSIRNELRNVVTKCRKLLEEAVSQVLQGQFGIYASGKKDEVHVEEESRMKNLSEEDKGYRRDIQAHLGHIEALGYKAKDSLAQLVREIAFTHLNRLCAYKMMEARAVWIGGKPFRESVSRGMKSQGFLFYLADHADDKKLFDTGHQDMAYRHFLGWLGALLSEEIGVLFSPTDPANRLFPPQRVLDDVLTLLNSDGLKDIWAEDETVGWVYQYFTPKELRDQVRKESAAPRNSYELAFRNQFFTPRYVVEFLTDNTLGRIWYEMRKGNTKLKEQCRYLVRRPDEVFLSVYTDPSTEFPRQGCIKLANQLQSADEAAFPAFHADGDAAVDRLIDLALCVSAYETEKDCGEWHSSVTERIEKGEFEDFSTQDLLDFLFVTQRADRHGGDGSVWKEAWVANLANEVRRRVLEARKEDITQERLLKAPVFVTYRSKKDPRELRILDPACGSGHFLLYCFYLLLTIYDEAYADPDLGPKLREDYPTLEALRRDVPRLILAHNLHGIDIDLRCTQIAALALWLRCQRAYVEMGLKQDRPKITKSNIVCAEPMPGENKMQKEFVAELQPRLLGHLVEVVFDKMKLAGEAGSLLKIEEELRDAIAEAKQRWVAEHQQATDRKGRPLLFTRAEMERLANKTPQPQLFDFSEITDEQFWSEAEDQVLAALRGYAAHAANGGKLQRQLFAEDAAQGFAFIDLCQKRFDVVLMNPPFGDVSKGCDGVLENVMARAGRDLGCAFVSEAASRLCPGGLIAALLTATPLFQPTFSDWRQRLVLGRERTTSVLAHLGGNVLDEATVIVCAFVSSEAGKSLAPFLRLDRCDNKEQGLLDRIGKLRAGVDETGVFLAVPDEFRKLKGSPVSYWISARFRHRLASLPPLEGDGGTSKQGTATADEFRFARAWWEVPPDKRWINYSKSSEYSPFWDDPTWLLNFGDDGRELRETGRARIQGTTFFGKPGVTYPSKSVLGFNPRTHPAGAGFGHSGSAVFPKSVSPACMLGYLASRPAEYALSLLTGSLQGEAGFRPVHYEVGVVGSLSFPQLSAIDQERIAGQAITAIGLVRSLFISDETSRDFVFPMPPIASDMATLDAFAKALSHHEVEVVQKVRECQSSIDDVVSQSLQLTAADVQEMNREFESRVAPTTGRWRPYFGAEPDPYCPSEAVNRVFSYCLGCVLGRWDVRYAVEMPKHESADPFAPIAARPPGMLADGIRQTEGTSSSGKYPLRIDTDGIIPDDPDHADDIIRRVREVLELIWKDRTEAIEKEACEILGIKELRDYFRKPGKGGFWDDHVSRYSKSRRKAPIYWLLQSSKKNYGLWLYYHRLDKDILFKARQNYVDPKIRLEQTRLDSLWSQKAALGSDAKGAKKIDKNIERQETLLGELKDFADKLDRAAKLNFGDPAKLYSDVKYDPDLNDGVVLNIAPLWELVPWKEAKNYWGELLEGKYEWSSMGKMLRKKGLV